MCVCVCVCVCVYFYSWLVYGFGLVESEPNRDKKSNQWWLVFYGFGLVESKDQKPLLKANQTEPKPKPVVVGLWFGLVENWKRTKQKSKNEPVVYGFGLVESKDKKMNQ